jgi:hypothetical protein
MRKEIASRVFNRRASILFNLFSVEEKENLVRIIDLPPERLLMQTLKTSDNSSQALKNTCISITTRWFLESGGSPDQLCQLLPEEIAAFLRKPDYHYVPNYYGSSQHKQTDLKFIPVFGDLAHRVIDSQTTLLNYDRLYTLFVLLTDLFRSDRPCPGAVAEVGVYKGGSLHFMANLLSVLGRNDVALHGFDTFAGHAAQDILQPLEPNHTPGLFSDTLFEKVSTMLEVWPTLTLHQGRFQETCPSVAQTDFAFVHLDADLYSVTRDALAFFAPRVVPGGVIILDDYGFTTTPGVLKAAEEFCGTVSGWRLLPLLTGQGVLIHCGPSPTGQTA